MVFEKRKMQVLGMDKDDVVGIGSFFYGPPQNKGDGLIKRTKVEEFI